jgi:nucleotide-binding universal stress UspA family protein
MTALQAKFTEALEARANRVRGQGLTCSSSSVEGAAAQEIVRRATQSGADLIVVGTHGRSGLTHALVGSVAERVVQHATCPVLVVPHREARSGR